MRGVKFLYTHTHTYNTYFVTVIKYLENFVILRKRYPFFTRIRRGIASMLRVREKAARITSSNMAPWMQNMTRWKWIVISKSSLIQSRAWFRTVSDASPEEVSLSSSVPLLTRSDTNRYGIMAERDCETVSDPTMQVSNENKNLGFRPQKELVYNKLLPYADELDAESRKMLAEIKENLGRAVMLREIRPGCAQWTSRLNM